MPKPKDAASKSVKGANKIGMSNEVIACDAPTSKLARHIPNKETVEALQDTAESHKLSDYDSFEAFMQAILNS